jgi:plasmid stability protein
MTPEENQRFQTLERMTVSMAAMLGKMASYDLVLCKCLVALATNLSSLNDDLIERLRARASSEEIPAGPEKRKILSLIFSKLEQPKDQFDAELARTAEMLKKVSAETRVIAVELQKLCLPNQPPNAPS